MTDLVSTADTGTLVLTAAEIALASDAALPGPDAEAKPLETSEPQDGKDAGDLGAGGTDAAGGTEAPTSSDADAAKESAVKDDGGTEAPAAPISKTGEEKDESKVWYTEDDLQLADSYGVAADELQNFGTREAFGRAASLLDRHLVSGAAPPVRQQPAVAQPAVTASPSPMALPDAAGAPTALDLARYEEQYDDDTVNVVKHTLDLEQRLAGMESMMQQDRQDAVLQGHDAFINEFHSAVDGMDEELYGRQVVNGSVVNLGVSPDGNRRQLYEQAMVLREGIEQRALSTGQPAKSLTLPILLKRAEQLAFGDVLRTRDQQGFQEKVSQQSRRRRSVATGTRPKTAPLPPVAAEVDAAQDIANHPDVIKLWEATGGK